MQVTSTLLHNKPTTRLPSSVNKDPTMHYRTKKKKKKKPPISVSFNSFHWIDATTYVPILAIKIQHQNPLIHEFPFCQLGFNVQFLVMFTEPMPEIPHHKHTIQQERFIANLWIMFEQGSILKYPNQPKLRFGGCDTCTNSQILNL